MNQTLLTDIILTWTNSCNEILSDWPVKVLCRKTVRGIMRKVRSEFEYGSCNCEEPGLDPRMSVVRDLFKNFKEV